MELVQLLHWRRQLESRFVMGDINEEGSNQSV